MDRSETETAALNNALWCDAVCRAHGRPGEFLPGLWLNRSETPRFYPNLVTLSVGDLRRQIDAIAALVDSGLPGDWGVKDSFAALDLAPLGFRVLFEAQWLRLAESAPAAPADAALRCTRLRHGDELLAWEAAWAGAPAAAAERIFPPTLLDDPDVAVLAVQRGDGLLAGLVANRGAAAVGVSNFYSRGDDEVAATCLAAVREIFPGLDLVGYETGPRQAAFERLGFRAIGPLRVWVRDHPLPRFAGEGNRGHRVIRG